VSGPLVSVVMPSYQQGRYLDAAIRSVLDQDYPAIELLVLDGGSNDESLDVIRRYEDRLAYWTSGPDGGQADALNRGFARARGELLGWLNADDELLPGAVSAVVEAFAAQPDAVLVYGDNVLVDEDGRKLEPLPARPFDLVEMVRTAQNHVPQPGSLFRREAFERVGPLNEAGYYYFDFELVLSLGLIGQALRLPRALGLYRLHPESKSTGAPVAKARDHLRLYDEIFARADLTPELRAVEQEARSRAELVAGEYLYAGLEPREARALLLRGLRRHPRHLGRRPLSLLARTLLPTTVVRRLRSARAGGGA
jgi:glycosyltransferase involved in cell wall biosynthesis